MNAMRTPEKFCADLPKVKATEKLVGELVSFKEFKEIRLIADQDVVKDESVSSDGKGKNFVVAHIEWNGSDYVTNFSWNGAVHKLLLLNADNLPFEARVVLRTGQKSHRKYVCLEPV